MSDTPERAAEEDDHRPKPPATASSSDATVTAGASKVPAGPHSLTVSRYILLAMVLVVCVLQLTLPDVITLWKWWVGPPLIEAPLALWAFVVLRHEANWSRRGVRAGVGTLIALMVCAVIFNSAMLLTLLFNSSNPSGTRLLLSGFAVVTMNVFSFSLIYWWWDGGGPVRRRDQGGSTRDLLFPQQVTEEDWQPRLPDYVYTAYTNVFAFSPTDTMPLTLPAKGFFALQSAVALATIMVTLALAVNLLN